MSRILPALAAALLLLTAGCNLAVNRSLRMADGEQRSEGLNTVNGSITIGRDCRLGGPARTVNGRIRVGEGSEVETLQAVNGRIELGARVSVEGDVEAVNGSVTIAAGSRVDGDVSSVNGHIVLEDVDVHHDVATHNGDIDLEGGTVVGGDVVVKKSGGRSDRTRVLAITLSGRSVVRGDIVVEERDIEVEVRIEEGSEVRGRVVGATVIRP